MVMGVIFVGTFEYFALACSKYLAILIPRISHILCNSSLARFTKSIVPFIG